MDRGKHKMNSKHSKLSVKEVNCLENDEFERKFGNVIELCANAAKQVMHTRPFTNVSQICSAFHRYLEELSTEEKLVILKLHPDLAGRLVTVGELTPESCNEQKSAGLLDLSVVDKKTIDESNRRYRDKFGFPFIICARENKIQSIIAGLRTRYENTKDQEMHIGIEEVKKICRLRILDIVKEA